MKYWILWVLMPGLIQSCKKEEIYVYEVNDVTVSQTGAYKPNAKSDNEIISIAYTDLFGATISQADLDDLALAYKSFGDKRMIIDMIILNFLNDPTAQIPTDAEMRSNPDQFIEDTFKKFLVRQPNEFEKWFVKDKIEKNGAITPDLVYYAFMTCNEYRFY